ncbi:MAG TPA: outer membrane beta-barrel protein [Candidatus Binatia bacterium]|nr:outer membrane beta-barrel protein [Candidatus Binatia bacterium]
MSLRRLMFAVLALSAGAASAQSSTAGDENRILESGSQEGTTAAPPAEEEEMSTTYSGIGLSRISTSFSNVDPAINLDVAMGFRVPTVQWIGVELNLGFSMIPGQVTETNSTTGTTCTPLEELLGNCTPTSGATTSSQDDFQALNLGAYAVLRSPGRFYGMGKLGYRYLNTSLPELSDDRSGTAWGIGFGYRWNKRGSYAELHYTRLSADLSAIGFELAYGFDRH